MTPDTVRAFYEQFLRDHRQACDTSPADAANGPPAGERFLQPYTLPSPREAGNRAGLPAGVLAAFDYYFPRVEGKDWGNVGVLRVPVEGATTYAVRVTTDGDDGWLEVFDDAGRELAAGRTYLGRVSWGDTATLRGQVESGELPPGLTGA